MSPWWSVYKLAEKVWIQEYQIIQFQEMNMTSVSRTRKNSRAHFLQIMAPMTISFTFATTQQYMTKVVPKKNNGSLTSKQNVTQRKRLVSYKWSFSCKAILCQVCSIEHFKDATTWKFDIAVSLIRFHCFRNLLPMMLQYAITLHTS
jgi:hypothetical protein